MTRLEELYQKAILEIDKLEATVLPGADMTPSFQQLPVALKAHIEYIRAALGE